MRKLFISTLLACTFVLMSPSTTQSSNRVQACLNVGCGTLGNSICNLAWWPNEDGTVTWYWCVMIDVIGERPMEKI